MNYCDIGVIVILLLYVIQGWRKGFILSIIGIASMVAAFLVSKNYYLLASDLLKERTTIYENLSNFISKQYSDLLMSDISLPQAITDESLYHNLVIPDNIKKQIIKFIMKTDQVSTVDNVEMLSDFFINIISMIGLFFLTLIVIKLLGMLLNALAELPVLNEINKFAGIIFGLIKGVVYVYIIMAILAVISPLITQFDILQQINSSVIAIYFYKYNLIFIIGKLFFS